MPMTCERRTARRFTEEQVCRHPQNAALFADEVLSDVIRGGNSTAADRRAARAEFAVRSFLSRNRYRDALARGLVDVEGELIRAYGGDLLVDFFAWCEDCCTKVDPRASVEKIFERLAAKASSVDAQEVEALRRAFRPWLEADGLIPVIGEEASCLLPFHFTDAARAGEVVDCAGRVVPEWTEHVSLLARNYGLGMGVQVEFLQNARVGATGDSLMLPVLVAWHRRQGLGLPRYNKLRFLSTGAIEGDRIRDVTTEEKVRKVSLDVDNGFLVRPGNGIDTGTVLNDERVDAVLEKIRAWAEGEYLSEPSNVLGRLRHLDGVVRNRHVGDWEGLGKRLCRLTDSVDPEIDGDEYVLGLMLQSSACCHAGETGRAKELNARIQARIGEDPSQMGRLLRLQVEELVILQDEEDFAKIFDLAPDLESRIGACAQTSSSQLKHDLLMRYHGTMGQFVTYACLTGVSDCDPARSREHFDKALCHAAELARLSKAAEGAEERTDAVLNCAQDANYCVLHRAFWGTSDEVLAAAKKAKRYALRAAAAGDVAGAEKNDIYRCRFAALAQYRAVLENREIPEFADEDLPSVAAADLGWIAATVGKYLGAVAASRGNIDLAISYFSVAREKLLKKVENVALSGLFGVIHMTILAEAYRSLRTLAPDAAAVYRAEALSLFCRSSPELEKKSDWRDWLQADGDDCSFPGLRYWY